MGLKIQMLLQLGSDVENTELPRRQNLLIMENKMKAKKDPEAFKHGKKSSSDLENWGHGPVKFKHGEKSSSDLPNVKKSPEEFKHGMKQDGDSDCGSMY